MRLLAQCATEGKDENDNLFLFHRSFDERIILDFLDVTAAAVGVIAKNDGRQSAFALSH